MKLNLDKVYHFDGKQYGPGEVEVPGRLAEYFDAKARAGESQETEAKKKPAKRKR